MACVLLVEDEQDLRESLRDTFPWNDLSIDCVLTASCAAEAFACFERSPADVLITDIRMPGLSGIDLARQLMRTGRPLSVIFISAYNDVAYLKAAISIQAADYLFKPIDHLELKSALAKALQTCRHQRARTALLNDYHHELRLSLLSSLLMKRAEPVLLSAQMCVVDLPCNGIWFAVFAAAADIEILPSSLREALPEIPLETYVVALDEKNTALLLQIPPVFVSDTLRHTILQLCQSHDASLVHVDNLLQLYGMGSEYLRQRVQESLFSENSLANASELCRRILDTIHTHYMDPQLSASTIANTLHYTVSYLCATFKRERGETIHNYINKVRLDNACRMLEQTKARISSIAEQTGYENEAYFSRVFKREIGLSPLAYRKKQLRGTRK